nr:helicase-related protein [Bacillus pinisoli]
MHSRAIHQTKEKVYEDLNRYLEKSESVPTFEQYLVDREHIIVQIWSNVWVNIAASHTSLKEKRSYLSNNQQLDIDNLSRKQINQLFRTEIKNYHAFDVTSWLNEVFSTNKENWEARYKTAREAFFKREKKRQELELKNHANLLLEKELDKLFTEHFIEFYINVRYFMARKISMDIHKNSYILDHKLMTFEKLLYQELEENLQRNAYDYMFEVDPEDKYRTLVYDYMLNYSPSFLVPLLSSEVKEKYQKGYGVLLTPEKLRVYYAQTLHSFSSEIFDELLDEYVEDLIELEKIPFDQGQHKEILFRDLNLREVKMKEELLEQERQKEEEARMLEDIFGQVYNSSLNSNIHFTLHVGETNTGKTYQALQRMMSANSGMYLAPLRLLALEVFDKLNNEGVACSLKTGEEEKIIPGAHHIASTVEMFHEKDFYEIVVIDESQMIADKDRGFAWYKAITKANAKEVHIIGSYSMRAMILQLVGKSNITIKEYVRDTPLKVEDQEFKLKYAKKGDALICFSRRRVLETASLLQREGKKVSMIYGSMPPETRRKQIQLFIEGINSIIVATDAIGMGLNLPIRRIVFLENEKFDGTTRRRLTSQEVKQIAGRAGRKGLYNVGRVAFSEDIRQMSALLNQVDEPIQTFAIAPTFEVLERFQKYSRSLGDFFYLWDSYESPDGTKKATLAEERVLYQMVEGTMIEARMSIQDLYGFLHLPFSSYEPVLAKQWYEKLKSIVEGGELPEPVIKLDNLEELELSYKAVGLHLLFLYKLDQRTETAYWEKIRMEISDKIHDSLRTNVQTKQRKCRICGAALPTAFTFHICDSCHQKRYEYKRVYNRKRRE